MYRQPHTLYIRIVFRAPRAGAAVHWYGKAEARPGRKMAHVTFCANTMKDLKDKVRAGGARQDALLLSLLFFIGQSNASGAPIKRPKGKRKKP